jgi:hypothetical protein
MAAYQRQNPDSMLFALITVPAKGKATMEIPSEYRGFQHLFEEEKGKEALPRHQL